MPVAGGARPFLGPPVTPFGWFWGWFFVFLFLLHLSLRRFFRMPKFFSSFSCISFLFGACFHSLVAPKNHCPYQQHSGFLSRTFFVISSVRCTPACFVRNRKTRPFFSHPLTGCVLFSPSPPPTLSSFSFMLYSTEFSRNRLFYRCRFFDP